MNLEQFVTQAIERTQAEYASFRIEVGDEERVVVWTRVRHGGDGERVDLFIVLRVYTNPQRLRGFTSTGIELMDQGMDRDALQRIAALIIPGKRASEIMGTSGTEVRGDTSLLRQRGSGSSENGPRVYQQITLIYDLRWEEMGEDERRGYVAVVAESAQRKLRSIPGLLVKRVVEVQIGPYEVVTAALKGKEQNISLQKIRREYLETTVSGHRIPVMCLWYGETDITVAFASTMKLPLFPLGEKWAVLATTGKETLRTWSNEFVDGCEMHNIDMTYPKIVSGE